MMFSFDRLRLIGSSVAVSVLATSCASFPKNQLAKVPDGAASVGKKIPATYSLSSGNALTGRVSGNTQQNAVASKPLVSAFEKSGRFTSVKSGAGGAVHVEADMHNHGNLAAAAISGYISGLTFMIIPAVGTDNYTLTATVKTASGRSKKYVLEDGVTTVIWLPMIFAMPVKNPTVVVPEVQENMYRNLLEKMAQDGMLPR